MGNDLYLVHTFSFPLTLQGISRQQDIYGNYIFLNVKSGCREITELHSSLYLKLFEDKPILPFIPHMTIGNLDSADKMEKAFDSIKHMETCFETIIRKVSVERIGKNGESIIIMEKNLR